MKLGLSKKCKKKGCNNKLYPQCKGEYCGECSTPKRMKAYSKIYKKIPRIKKQLKIYSKKYNFYRYNNDPEFRERVKKSSRDYQRRKNEIKNPYIKD